MNEYINNSHLIPKFVADDAVLMENGIPDWTKSAIVMQINFKTLTKEKTISAAISKLDYFREIGVNCLWVCPINERGENGNGYTNMGLHTIDPEMTGTKNYEDGWLVFRDFVREAHKRDIRIMLDIISWGTLKEAPLVKEHPDWFEGEVWGGAAFNWKNPTMKYWFIENAVEIAEKTEIDGFRYDVEPRYAGYEGCWQIKHRLLAKGRKLLMMSEETNERMDTYDLEQIGVKDERSLYQNYREPCQVFLEKENIVDCIKTGKFIGSERSAMCDRNGTFRYYTYCLSNHDYRHTTVNGNRLTIGYQAILAPFIPIWFLGDEWNNPEDEKMQVDCIYYVNDICWELMDDSCHRSFLEDVKKYINIRRTFADIFEYFPENHRESNICKIEADGNLQAYARYRNENAILVLPNNTEETKKIKATISLSEIGLENSKMLIVTDLLTDTVIARGTPQQIKQVIIEVKPQHLGILRLEGIK